MIREQVITIPVTYVNEEFSTFKAAKFIEMFKLTDEAKLNPKLLNGSNKEVYYI